MIPTEAQVTKAVAWSFGGSWWAVGSEEEFCEHLDQRRDLHICCLQNYS